MSPPLNAPLVVWPPGHATSPPPLVLLYANTIQPALKLSPSVFGEDSGAIIIY